MLFRSGPDYYDRAVTSLQRASALSPRDPFLAYWIFNQAVAEFIQGNYPGCVTYSLESLRRDPDFLSTASLLTAAYAHLGEQDKAEQMLEECVRLDPLFSVGRRRERISPVWKRSEDLERCLDGLAMAGARVE